MRYNRSNLVIGASPRDTAFGYATFALYAGISMAKESNTLILVAPCTGGSGSNQAEKASVT